MLTTRPPTRPLLTLQEEVSVSKIGGKITKKIELKIVCRTARESKHAKL